MYTFIIDQPGSLIYFESKEIRTPCIIKTLDKDIIETQLKSLGIKDYELISPIPKMTILNNSPLFLGCNKDTIDKRDYQFNSILKSSIINSLPQTIDYTNEMSSVKNQGRLGSCVGFAVAAMKEWQEKKEYLNEIESGIKYRRKSPEYDLSEMWIYYKSKEIDPWPNQEGTSIRCAIKQVCKLGVPPEKAWVYNDKIKGKPERWSPMIAKWKMGDGYFRVNNLNELLNVLNNYGPTVIGIYCFREIFNPGKSGIVKYPSNKYNCYGGHAICVTSFHRGSQLVKFKNSWGSNWGNKGYGYLPFKYIQDFMNDAWILIDKNVSHDELKK